MKLHKSKAGRLVADLTKNDGDVKRQLEFLPSERRQSIQAIFDKPSEYVLLSLRQVARKLHADPSTILRTLRALGFRHYADFRSYLHERVVAFATSSEPVEYTLPRSGVVGIVRSSVDCDLRNLKELRNSLDPNRVQQVAKRLWAARRIVIVAGDMTASLGAYLEYTLSMLGFNVFRASSAGEMMHRTRSVRKQDVVIAITYRRGLVYTVEAFKQASKKGAYCVGISDSFLSPLVELSDQFFITPTDRAAFADSYASGMAFINALLTAVVNVRRKDADAILKETAEEQRTGSRFYTREETRR
jgi:DNA-binding MurR/RpiR family transcriptional regulator